MDKAFWIRIQSTLTKLAKLEKELGPLKADTLELLGLVDQVISLKDETEIALEREKPYLSAASDGGDE